MKSGCIYCNAVRRFEGRFSNVRQKEKLCQRGCKLLNFDLKKEDNGVHNKTRNVYVKPSLSSSPYIHTNQHLSMFTDRSSLYAICNCSFSTAVLIILCSRGPFDMLLIVIIFTIQKSDFFMRQGIQSCLCKEMLAENCTAQNEAWCRLSAGQQESTEPQPAVRLSYEETLRLCALLLKVRALLTFWMSLVKVLSLSHFFYNVFLNKAAFI